MKFGGHETFFLRPGWLTKGLTLVQADVNVTWNSDRASDVMGVGRNMSKSIGWWLSRTGTSHRAERNQPLTLTPLGKGILENDPYLVQLATWWLLHFQLVLNGPNDVFSWFFGSRADPRFTRAALEGSLHAQIERSGEKMPAAMTLHRDIAVLLQSYGRPLPAPSVDPEDNLDCPFRRLDLIVHRTDLDVFERRSALSVIAPEALCFGLLSTLTLAEDSDYVDIPLDHMGALSRLGVATGRSVDAVADAIAAAAGTLDDDLLTIRQLAGLRMARVRVLPGEDWLKLHIHRTSNLSEAKKGRAA
ncbi:DUF4007 family protein [Loktanella sp. DJP18]|uniref:DUF4007 family protein n=1 Tax=Loktanella sp. DJP18 TaxID=3409788 RepID=UPI003BB68A20